MVKFDYLVVKGRGRGASGSGRDAKEGGVKGETGERKRKKNCQKKRKSICKKEKLVFLCFSELAFDQDLCHYLSFKFITIFYV